MPYKDKKKESEAKKKYWLRLSPEEKRRKYKKQYQAKKRRLLTDPKFAEKLREEDRLKKQKRRKLKKEQINERQRELYKQQGTSRKSKIYQARTRRNPYRGLASIIRDVKSGRRHARELIAATRTAIEQCRALIYRTKGAVVFEQHAGRNGERDFRTLDSSGLQTDSRGERKLEAGSGVSENQSSELQNDSGSDKK